MSLAKTGTAAAVVIFAYFFRLITSGYSLNVSDPIDGQLVQLSYYLCAFGCGLVFWLLVLLWAKPHGSGHRQADIRKVAKLAKLITSITTLNLALLLLWAFLSLKEYMILVYTHRSGENSGGYEGRGQDEGKLNLILRFRNGGPGSGGRETNAEQISLIVQIVSTVIGFHSIPTPSSSSKALLDVALLDNLVAYLCCLTSILLSSNKPDSKAAKIFGNIGFVCTALGFILMLAMFLSWYLVLIAVLLFGVVWLIFFWNGLRAWATNLCCTSDAAEP